MGCSDVNATEALNYLDNSLFGQSEWQAKAEAIRLNEYCSPEMSHTIKAV
ncbi:MAG TPA: hypothetical protein VIK78_18885 [Ruminiclostridium sp.]